MADPKPSSKKPKRRLKPSKPAASVREQASKRQSAAAKTKKRSWFGKIGHQLARPFRAIASWSVWRSKPLLPVRWLIKIIGYIFFIPYIRSSLRELKQVTWPSFGQTNRLTFAVLIFAAVFGAVIALADYGLDHLFRDLILK